MGNCIYVPNDIIMVILQGMIYFPTLIKLEAVNKRIKTSGKDKSMDTF